MKKLFVLTEDPAGKFDIRPHKPDQVHPAHTMCELEIDIDSPRDLAVLRAYLVKAGKMPQPVISPVTALRGLGRTASVVPLAAFRR